MQLILFNKNGRFTMPSDDALSQLDAEQSALFAPVKVAAAEVETAERNLKIASDNVAEGVETLDAATKYHAKNFPTPTYHELWRSMTSRPDKVR